MALYSPFGFSAPSSPVASETLTFAFTFTVVPTFTFSSRTAFGCSSVLLLANALSVHLASLAASNTRLAPSALAHTWFSVSAAYTISFCKNVHASGVSDPIIAAASVMATICFPTLLMFLLYLSFLLHFSCKNLPAPSIYPVLLNKKAIACCFPYFRERVLHTWGVQ